MIIRSLRMVPLVLAAALILGGCSSQGGGGGGQPTRLDAAGFAEFIAGSGVVVLDVRTPEEFASGHLEGALNIDVNAGDFAEQIADLDHEASYAIYCRSGNRSQTAMALMDEAGFGDLRDLDGGILAWTQAGYPAVS